MRSRIWIGSLFILFGLGFLLHQMDVWDLGIIIKMWWPLIFIIIGVEHLLNRKNTSPLIAFMFLIIGGVLLLNQWIDFNLTVFIWPLLFIFIGTVIIFSRIKHERTLDYKHSIESFSLFSGTNLRSQSNDFQGGNVTAIFGGAEIDLRDTIISEEGAMFNLTTVFGGIVIIVPENTRVEISGLPIFGGWEDKTRHVTKDKDAALIKINSLTVFGGIEVKD